MNKIREYSNKLIKPIGLFIAGQMIYSCAPSEPNSIDIKSYPLANYYDVNLELNNHDRQIYHLVISDTAVVRGAGSFISVKGWGNDSLSPNEIRIYDSPKNHPLRKLVNDEKIEEIVSALVDSIEKRNK